MSYLTFLWKLRIYSHNRRRKRHHPERPKISILIPFSSDDPVRIKTFNWLLTYLSFHLPKAEIIIGKSRSEVFCKGEAFNDAYRRSNGKVLVLLDADAYMKTSTIEECADNILEAESRGHNLWYVPYRKLYRLTKEVTEKIVDSDPRHPYELELPIRDEDHDNKGYSYKYGHRYGAMVTIIPRKAMEAIKCFDERFKGWGGEDIAFLRAMDTMFGKNKSVNENMYHLWHVFIGETHQKRMWQKQTGPNPNGTLTYSYHLANRQYNKMKKIIDESYEYYLCKNKLKPDGSTER